VEITPHDLHLPMHSTGDFQGLWEAAVSGLPAAPKRSTLAYANAHRHEELLLIGIACGVD
jgi:hypothetical protein